MHRKFIYLLLVLTLLPALLMAGTKGRIKGKVVSKETGDPLVGANVVVVGTTFGAASDANGEYTIYNLDPGTYSLKASYISHQSVVMSGVRVNADLTSYIDFPLSSKDLTVKQVEIVAQRPMIKKDNTNAVHVTTSEDMQSIPVRGVNGFVALQAGVVVKDNTLFIRGGRQDEVGYYLEGASVTNPMTGGRAVTLSQDAVEEIQVQAGGYTAEFGGANSGIVRQSLKSGGNDFHASLEYITDNIGFKSKSNMFDGKKTLGAYTYGYDETSGVISGPILPKLFSNRVKYFLNVDYLYNLDSNPQAYPGVNVGWIKDPSTKDSINLVYPGGPIKGNYLQRYNYTGTLNIDLHPLMLRFSGTYADGQAGLGGKNTQPLGDILNSRVREQISKNGSFNLKATYVINPKAYAELSGGYFFASTVNQDPYLKDNYWAYGDSVANAKVGYVWTRKSTDVTGRYIPMPSYTFADFDFTRPGDVGGNYNKTFRSGLNFNGALTFNAGENHTFKLGGEYNRYTIRQFQPLSDETGYAALLNSKIETAQRSGTVTAAQVDQFKKDIMISGGVNNYGYDVLGNEDNSDGPFGAHHPVFGAAYAQDRIEYQDIVLNLGLRWDYINIDNKEFENVENPSLTIDKDNLSVNAAHLKAVDSYQYLSPRLGFSFPVTEKTMFHAQYGKFVQQPNLATAYYGWYGIGYMLKGGLFFSFINGNSVKPTTTTQYELGFTQQLTDFMSVDITGYYKDIKDQVEFVQQTVITGDRFGSYNIYTNGDFATTKGLELSLNMRRYERLSMNATLSYQDAEGTGSFPNSNRGIVGTPVENQMFIPKYISPLEFNNALRGNLNLDYRFGKDDGPAILHEFGVSTLLSYNSGHPYTRGYGNVKDLEGDARSRYAAEPLNASVTPSEFQVDLRIDKTVHLFDKLSANIYVYVINLFDAQNIENVFLRTGSTSDDGYITNPELAGKLIQTYGQKYVDVWKAVNIDYQQQYKNANGLNTSPNFWGPPRQIRLGVRLEY